MSTQRFRRRSVPLRSSGCCLKVSHSQDNVEHTPPLSKTHKKSMDPCLNKTPGSTIWLRRRNVETAARLRVEQKSCRVRSVVTAKAVKCSALRSNKTIAFKLILFLSSSFFLVSGIAEEQHIGMPKKKFLICINMI